jgi:hypothetical protein
LPQRQISSNAPVPIYEMGSQHKTSLFQKRIACTSAPGPFCEERVSFFEFTESAASFRKQHRPFLATVQRSPPKVERVVLNALAEQMPLCRLISVQRNAMETPSCAFGEWHPLRRSRSTGVNDPGYNKSLITGHEGLRPRRWCRSRSGCGSRPRRRARSSGWRSCGCVSGCWCCCRSVSCGCCRSGGR